MQLSAALQINRLNKSFVTPSGVVHALKDIQLHVRPGEFVTIIGPSGCGKSTLLKIIAGLDIDYDGEVLLDQQPVRKPGIDKGFIFQEHRLFPWLTVERNIAADLPLSRPDTRRKVDELIEAVRLKGFEKRTPASCPGECPSAWRSPGRSCAIRKFCCSTSRSERSTLSREDICRKFCSTSGEETRP
ncbi:hypothetical protein PACILC2_32080 [Paenibacillus cisolokensis]|uniref:ABC transporter domain-containing protein n=1 Tax=Paenibacillus cisolokensis TaxID=1658519 RepID=A0ABQ4N8Y8_9BACL|nr:hypothetical protein PACILC2_32080 [Paenibacillus cisolokensis]